MTFIASLSHHHRVNLNRFALVGFLAIAAAATSEPMAGVSPPGGTYLDEVLTDGPVAYWRLGETSGATAADLSGNGNDASYQDGVTLGVPGLLSGDSDAAVGVGTNNEYIESKTSFLTTTDGITVEVWFVAQALNDIQPLFVSGYMSGTVGFHWLSLFHDDTGNFLCWSYANGVTDSQQCIHFAPLVGKRYHLVVTHDYAAKQINFYINGNLYPHATKTHSDDVVPLSGQWVRLGTYNGQDSFTGVLDEVAIYAGVLSASRILAHSTAGGSANSPDIYVAPPPLGSDEQNDGSQESPLASIQYAADAVLPGATVHVAPGTYFENVLSTVSGIEAARVVFVSEPKWGAQIQASDNYNAWRNTGSYVDIIGFELSGAKYSGISNSGSNVRIIGNSVHDIGPGPGDCQGQGGIVTGTDNLDAQGHPLDDAHDVDTISNLVYNIGLATTGCQGRSPHGIYYGARLGHIMNNIVHHAKGYGIETWHWARGSSTSPLDISNNLVFENGYEDATGAYGGGIDVGTGDENLPNGIVADYFRLSNNIVIYNYFGLFESTDGVSRLGNNIFYRNNTVYGNSNTWYPDANLSLYDWHLDGAHLIATYTADPMLVNYQSDGLGDYHLASGSPSIGSGTSLGAPGDDFDGLARPQDQAYDRGPYVWRP